MAENSNGGNGGLYFIVGGLVVVVGLGVFAYSGGYIGGHGNKTITEQTTIEAPRHAEAEAPRRPESTTTTTTTEQSKH